MEFCTFWGESWKTVITWLISLLTNSIFDSNTCIGSIDDAIATVFSVYERQCLILVAKKPLFLAKIAMFLYTQNYVAQTVKASGCGWSGLPDCTGTCPGIRGTFRNANIVRTYCCTLCTTPYVRFLAKNAGHRVYKTGSRTRPYVPIVKVGLLEVGDNLQGRFAQPRTLIVTYDIRQVHLFGV